MKIFALILCIACIGLVVLSGILAMISPMMMDAPGSEESTANWIFVYSVIASPVGFLVADILAWIQFAKGNYRASIRWVLLGFVPIVFGILALVFV